MSGTTYLFDGYCLPSKNDRTATQNSEIIAKMVRLVVGTPTVVKPPSRMLKSSLVSSRGAAWTRPTTKIGARAVRALIAS
jgi:hypothetical protein